MKKFARAALTFGVLCSALLLVACEDFDPTALFDSDIFNTKKKLPGERKPVFPEGTPGVPQGVPQELVKGYQPPAAPENPAKQSAVPKESATQKEATAEPTDSKPKPQARPKAKPKVVAKPAEPSGDVQQSAPSGAVTVRPTSQGPQWPDPPAAQQGQAPAEQGTVAGRWPGAPASGGGVAWPDPPASR
jgi:hypothetical protein